MGQFEQFLENPGSGDSTFSFTSGICYLINNNIYNDIHIYIELMMSALRLM